jgi:hypothetical protein
MSMAIDTTYVNNHLADSSKPFMSSRAVTRISLPFALSLLGVFLSFSCPRKKTLISFPLSQMWKDVMIWRVFPGDLSGNDCRYFY